MAPEIIISTKSQPTPAVVPFSALFSQRESITQMTLLWDYNSYHVNLSDKYFIVNGGRKLFFEDNIEGEIRLLYARRNRMSVSIGSPGADCDKFVSAYLLGVESDKKKLFLIISDDGAEWGWKDNR